MIVASNYRYLPNKMREHHMLARKMEDSSVVEEGFAGLNKDSDKVHVLVVDDHDMIRKTFVSLIQKEPDIAIVGEAENGEKAIEMAFEHTPDVILMDVNMPQMNGIEASRIISAKQPGIRIIGLSIDTCKATVEAMLAAGASDFCSKDGSSEELLAAIRKHASAKAAINGY